ncbi:MAG: hypothetical protein M1499_04310, partial [Firmicutes bacterium]|nr:hypothetical protein [Bacillota bacterium]
SSNIGDTETVVPLLPQQQLEPGMAATIKLTAPQPTYDVLAQYGLGTGVPTGSIPSVMANTNTDIYLGAFVADQNQVPLPIGAGYGDAGTVVVHVSGPATLSAYNDYTDTTVTGLQSTTLDVGGYSGFYDSVQLVPNPNANGMVTLTLTNPTNGLQVGTPVQVMVVPPQTANSWSVTSSPSTSSFTSDQVASDAYAASNLSEKSNIWTLGSGYTLSPTWSIQAVDANGLSEPAQAPAVSVTMNGQPVSNLVPTISGSASGGNYTVGMDYVGGNLSTGTYDITLSEGLMQTLTIPVTITAGVPNKIGVTPAAGQTIDVTPTNPSLTVTGQVEDILGNAVAAPGATLTFADTTNSNELQLSGGAGSVSDQTVNVNSSGAASVTASAVATGLDGAVEVTGTLANGTTLTGANSASIDETGSLVSKLVLGVTGNDYQAGSNYTSNGNTAYPMVTVTEENSVGAPLTNPGDTLNYTITGPAAYPGASGTVNGHHTIPVISDIAGTYTVTVTDASNSAVAPVSTTVTIVPGAADGVGLFANGSELVQYVPHALNLSTGINYNVPNDLNGTTSGTLSVEANTPQAVWIHVTDATGNIVNAPAGGVTVNLTQNGTGAFEATQGGAPQTSFVIPAGQNGIEVWYVDTQTQTVNVGMSYQAVATATFAGTSNGVATQGGSSGAYTYAWTVNVADQFGNPINNLTYAEASLVDTSASPEVTYTGAATLAAGDFTVAPTSTPGQYTITAESSTTVPTTDVAHITIDGSTINGTF